ncbi:MAG: bifunctional folylpolyglutamate synthase/dihydrofolate synthase [Trueperaceae bacterium]|nr:bifunctional folylpolyglutamate synthase/dihydrofolate synthase [Trueperaceae bacterium]
MTTPPGDATAALFARQRLGVVPGLERMGALLERLGRPQDAFEAVVVAGTNGKGGTVAHLDAMLRAGGASVGRYVSPHLTHPGERVAVDGVPMDDAAFEAAAAHVRPHADATDATFFEAVTALAFVAFAEAGVDEAVLEVGLGGRLDAVNVVTPTACAVAQVALDHQALLGPDVASIAREKAGVLRTGVPAWTTARGEARRALRQEAARLGAPLAVADVAPAPDADAELEIASRGLRGSEVRLRRPGRADVDLATPLVGAAQAGNAALAALVALELGVTPDAVADGAARTRWPGRLEVVGDATWRRVAPDAPAGAGPLLLDGAHNPAAARAAAATLERLALRPTLVASVAEDKDVAGLLAAFAGTVRGVVATRAERAPRTLPARDLAAAVEAAGLPLVGVHDAPRDAVAAALTHGGPVLVAGSLFLVGEVRPWLRGEPDPAWERWQ